jgi:16S rRNA processing protein RimM
LTDPAPGLPEWLPSGRVGKPHGLDGSFHLTRPRAVLLALGRTIRVGETETEIVRFDGTADRPILKIALAGNREAIEALRGADVYARREDAPALGTDEYWAEQLEGCVVRDGDSEIGVVARLRGLPSCDVLEVTRADGEGELLVPLVRDAVRSVDVAARVIDVDLGFLGE